MRSNGAHLRTAATAAGDTGGPRGTAVDGRPLRIAVLTRGDLFPPWHGAAAKIVGTAEALAAGGDEVFVVTDDRDAYWHVQPGGWVQRPFGDRVRALEEWPVLRDQARPRRWLRRLGYPEEEDLLYVAMVDPAWWLRAAYVGLRERIDAWHAEFPGFGVPAVLAARLLGGTAVVTEHNVEWDRLRQTTALPDRVLRRLGRIEREVLHAADRVVTVSRADRDRLAAHGVDHVSVVPHGVDLGAFDTPPVDLRVRHGLPGGPVLFFHGTLHYAPNADAVRWIADTLLPALPTEVTVLVAGMNPPEPLASPRLRFTGAIPDLAAHIRAADLCICPVDQGGGTRMKLLEYFAAGKAVVATRVGAEGLDVQDGRELLFAERPHFAATVRRALEEPALRARLGHHARAYARARDWGTVTAALREVLRGGREDFRPRPDVEAHLPPRVASKPLTLLFLVNRGCNLKCRFCELWDRPEQVPLDRALRLVDQAAAIGTRSLVLTGGEPLLHPGLPELVARGRRHGMGVNVTTNGLLLDRHRAALVDAGVSSLSFSIDGLAATHDRLRGQKGAYARTWDALVRTLHEGRVDCAVYFTVTRENVHELVAVYDAVRALGARFDFWPVNDAPDLYLRDDADRAAWITAIETLARRDDEVARKAHYYREALAYHAGEGGPVRCLGLVDQYGVTYTGDLLPCCVWGKDGLVVGNVFETPLPELWAQPEVQAARERLWRAGCTAGCYNHSLYELTASTGRSHRLE